MAGPRPAVGSTVTNVLCFQILILLKKRDRCQQGAPLRRALNLSSRPTQTTTGTLLVARSWPGWRTWPPSQPGEGLAGHLAICLLLLPLLLSTPSTLQPGVGIQGISGLAAPVEDTSLGEPEPPVAPIIYQGSTKPLGSLL